MKVLAQQLSSAEKDPWAKSIFYCLTCIKFKNHRNEYIFYNYTCTCTCRLLRKLIMITVQQWSQSIYMFMYMDSSVDKSICPKCRVSWVQIPPEATHFHFFIASGVLTFFFSFFLSFHLKSYHVLDITYTPHYHHSSTMMWCTCSGCWFISLQVTVHYNNYDFLDPIWPCSLVKIDYLNENNFDQTLMIFVWHCIVYVPVKVNIKKAYDTMYMYSVDTIIS